MAVKSGQKFLNKNRAPRVQVEYDVEVYGSDKKVNLPFIMGVMSDLSGKPAEALPKAEERQFVEIDSDNLNDRLKSMKPRLAFNVPNMITGEGNLSIEMNFESMEDFSPAKVAKKIDGLKQILEARQQLSNLLSYMDGKVGAEELLNQILEDPALLKALSSQVNEGKKAKEENAQGDKK